MALTRAQAEFVLMRRLSGIYGEAGLATTEAGTNEDLNEPLRVALDALGYSVADVTSVADTDLDDLPSSKYNQFFDLAELRALENVEGQLTLVTTKTGPFEQRFSDLLNHVREVREERQAKYEKQYGGLRQTATIKALDTTRD